MKTAKGSTRRVFIFKDIVIKVARIYLYSAIRSKIIGFFFTLKIIRRDGKEYFIRRKKFKSERPMQLQEYEKHRIENEQSMEMECPRTKRYECYGTMAMMLMGGNGELSRMEILEKNKKYFCNANLLFFFWINKYPKERR